jgi:hypothetical protein
MIRRKVKKRYHLQRNSESLTAEINYVQRNQEAVGSHASFW